MSVEFPASGTSYSVRDGASHLVAGCSQSRCRSRLRDRPSLVGPRSAREATGSLATARSSSGDRTLSSRCGSATVRSVPAVRGRRRPGRSRPHRSVTIDGAAVLGLSGRRQLGSRAHGRVPPPGRGHLVVALGCRRCHGCRPRPVGRGRTRQGTRSPHPARRRPRGRPRPGRKPAGSPVTDAAGVRRGRHRLADDEPGVGQCGQPTAEAAADAGLTG